MRAAQQAQLPNTETKMIPQKFTGGRYKASATLLTVISTGALAFTYYHYYFADKILLMAFLALAINTGHAFFEKGTLRLASSRESKESLVNFYQQLPFILLVTFLALVPTKYEHGLILAASHLAFGVFLYKARHATNSKRKLIFQVINNMDDPHLSKYYIYNQESDMGIDLSIEKTIYEQRQIAQKEAHEAEEKRRQRMREEGLERHRRKQEREGNIQMVEASKDRKMKKQKTSERLYSEFDQEIMANAEHEKEAAEQEQKKRRETYEEALKDLESLIGMDNVKEEVKTFVADMVMIEKKKEAGIKHENAAMHMTFEGAAGTGKTTVARIISRILYGLGYLSSGHVVETDREGLIAGFVGQTAIKTKEKVTEAMGGVLFIDEAYALTPRGEQGFEREAVDTLVKLMEDHRDDLVIIFAGYTVEMKEFIKSNSGLQSRVPYRFTFQPYTSHEMRQIADVIIKQKDHAFDKEAEGKLSKHIESIMPYSANQNGRMIRNLLEKAMKVQNRRLFNEAPDDISQYKIIKNEDLEAALVQVILQSKENA